MMHQVFDELAVDGWFSPAEKLHDEGARGVKPQTALTLTRIGELHHERFTAAELVHDDHAKVREEAVLDVERVLLGVDESTHACLLLLFCWLLAARCVVPLGGRHGSCT